MAGVYKSERFSYPEECWLFLSEHIRYYATDCSLVLRADKSYTYTTCANIIKGYYKVVSDSLFLFCTENNYRIDSLNVKGYQGKFLDCGNEPIVFVKEGDRFKAKYSSSKGVTFTCLKKEN